MTKASANPRRYSRGAESLDENQPLNVFLAIHLEQEELGETIARLEYLAEKYGDADLDLAGYRREQRQVVLTLQIGMGPARAALRGTSTQVQAGYALLWDIVKTLFYAHPVFVGPPPAHERERVNQMSERPALRRTPTSASPQAI